jgi:hypothetical protein
MASYFKQGIYAGASSGPDGRAPPNGAIQFFIKKMGPSIYASAWTTTTTT